MEQNLNPVNAAVEQETPSEAALQAELDRRVREAVDHAFAEYEKNLGEDCRRMADMTDKERGEYAAARREAALAEREKRVTERELRVMAADKLAERGLPAALADVLTYSDEAACMAALDAMEKTFRQAVQTAVDQRLKGEVPAAGAQTVQPAADALSDEEYYRISAVRA